MNSTRTPVVFIHDLWLHPASWQPWLDLFSGAGYAPVAPAWPGVPATVQLARAHPDSRVRSLASDPGPVSLSAQQFRYAFGNAITAEESDALYEEWAIPAPGQPLLEAATANFTPHSPAEVDTSAQVRGPLLLVAGGEDHAVPDAVTEETFRQYRGSPAVTDLAEFADRGHSLTIDGGWRAIADECLGWLAKHPGN